MNSSILNEMKIRSDIASMSVLYHPYLSVSISFLFLLSFFWAALPKNVLLNYQWPNQNISWGWRQMYLSSIINEMKIRSIPVSEYFFITSVFFFFAALDCQKMYLWTINNQISPLNSLPLSQLLCAWQCFLLALLFDLIFYVPSTIFQLNRDGSSWVEPVLS